MKAGGDHALLLLAMLGLGAPVGAQVTERWTVDPEPSVSIGTVDGPEEDLLVNVLMGTVLSDGTIVLRNSTRGTFELRYYSPEGSHIGTVSRFGQGPYEFRYPTGVHRMTGDSILVVGEDDRFAVFGARGERVREGRVGLNSRSPVAMSFGLDRTRVVVPRYRGPRMPEEGTQRTPTVVYSHDLVEGHEDSIGVALNRRTHYTRMADRDGVHIYPAPFAPETYVAVGPGLTWIGDSEWGVDTAHSIHDGRPTMTIESPFPPRSVTSDDRRRVRDAYANVGSGDTQRRWARYARDLDFPEAMPLFGPLEVDRLGNLWLQEYEPYWATGPQRWMVYSPQGQPIAEVLVPETAIPGCSRRPRGTCDTLTGIFEIGADYILVPQTDEWDVRYLRQYRLRKPS